MAIPTCDQFIEPLLRHLARHPDGVRSAEAYVALADQVGLTPEERLERLPSRRQAVHHNRIGWAHDRLKRAGLSSSARRGLWKLTPKGERYANPILVVRYRDRIEIRNPGYSLVEDDQLGQPGPFPRNPRIADVFREMRLAENKGTGVAAMRRAMQRAGLTPPVFDSDRSRNLFIVGLWLHNLIGEDDRAWLEGFAHYRLTDEQARALVVAKRTGFVSNAMLRDISGLDTLSASHQLRQLRDQGLLELRGKGSATHYILAADPAVRSHLSAPSPSGEPLVGPQTGEQTGGSRRKPGGSRRKPGGSRRKPGGSRHGTWGREPSGAAPR